ncbi:O-antigen ligase [Halomonas daqiaonensis]|uniref:O-antigen ligase n=2 Tax=Halomonas daqiaonensis TaxID=650850 RepID=A0A1H7VXQ9_9GAMM|nr:O-antigen ligase family protein [Halomonas daqiaonensis]SEM13990.1 O-antigen ligase [Halomonas daqiaonensis]
MTHSLPAAAGSPLRLYTSLAVFLLGAIALVVPSGYSLGAVMLLLGSAVLLVKRPLLGLTRQDWWVIAALAAYTAIGVLEAWWDGQGSSGIDKPIRFLLAIPAMLLVMVYPPRLAWMWSGLAIGAMGAGGWASWQKLVEGVWRATGHTYVIQFGNLSMLLGILCLAGLGWAVVQPRRGPWVAFLLVGALMGILGSIFSGSRGGWIGFPFVLLVLYRGYGRHLSAVIKGAAVVVVVGGASLMYALPQTGVQSRVYQAFDDIERYASGESQLTSVGARFEMWKGATQLILEKPLMGWGDNGYQQGMQALADEGVINSGVLRFDHAHNEFIDAFAKRGIIGLAVLLTLYLIPMKLFARRLDSPDLEMRSLAVAGVLLCVAYIDFGLSQTFLTHNSGVMMFAFWLALLYGTLRARDKRQRFEGTRE